MLGTLALRGRAGRSGGRRSGCGRIGLHVASLHGPLLIGTSLFVAPTGTEMFRDGGWDPRPLVRRTMLTGAEAERCVWTSVAEVINSSGSLNGCQCCSSKCVFDATYVARIHCWVGHANPISCRPPCKHPTQGISEPGFSFFLGGCPHQSALPVRVVIVSIAQWKRRIFCPLP